MLPLNPLFSLWLGPNVEDFIYFSDTLLYAKVSGVILTAHRVDGGWEVDTLLLLSPGVRMMCRWDSLLYVAYFHRVLTYERDSLRESFYLPFVISGIACRADTLYLHDSHAIYLRLPGSAPVVLYRSEDGVKSFFFHGDTLYVFQRNYLLRLGDTLADTVIRLEGLADLSEVRPLDGTYVLHFGSGELALYTPWRFRGRKVRIILSDVEKFKVVGDTLMVLSRDTLRAYRPKFRGRGWRR